MNVATPTSQYYQLTQTNMAQSDEEDDYMNMVFEDAPKGPKYETSLQRAARKRKEVRLFAFRRCAALTVFYRARPEHDRRPKLNAKKRLKQLAKPRSLQRSLRPTRDSR